MVLNFPDIRFILNLVIDNLQISNLEGKIEIFVRKYEKKKGSNSLIVDLSKVTTATQLLELVRQEFEEETLRKILRTADDNEVKLKENLENIKPGQLYHALSEEQEKDY
jgi:hypothetical protein